MITPLGKLDTGASIPATSSLHLQAPLMASGLVSTDSDYAAICVGRATAVRVRSPSLHCFREQAGARTDFGLMPRSPHAPSGTSWLSVTTHAEDTNLQVGRQPV
jgi:hypothetical protein